MINLDILVVGLTGQTGAGKSTVARLLEENGVYNIDADYLSRIAVENPEVISAFAENFGDDVVVNGSLDRREVARRAFSDPEKQKKLNAIVHPEVTRLAVEEIHKAEKENAKAVLIDAALLFESDLTSICSFTVSVVADKETRLERIIKRDSISREDALIRMNAQKSEEYYIKNADVVISNNGEDLNTEIKKVIEKI